MCKGWEAGGGPEGSGKARNMLGWLWGADGVVGGVMTVRLSCWGFLLMAVGDPWKNSEQGKDVI